MRTLCYASGFGLPRAVSYVLALSDVGLVEIVVVEPFSMNSAAWLSHDHTSRDTVLNRILQLELVGVDIRYVRLYVLTETQTPGWLRGFEFPLYSKGGVIIPLAALPSAEKKEDFLRTGRWRTFIKKLADSASAPLPAQSAPSPTQPVFYTDPVARQPLTPDKIELLSRIIDYRNVRRRTQSNWHPQRE